MSLGRLVVELTCDSAAFISDMGKAAHQAAKNMEQIQREAEKAGKMIGAMFAAGAGLAVLLTKRALDNADALNEMAQAAGVSVESLSALSFAAGLSGVNTEALATSLNRLNRNISDTASGTGEAREAFAALGISVKNNDGTLKNADQVMTEVAAKFAQMEDGAGKSALAIQLFGRSGAQMVPMLNQGAGGLSELRMEAEKLGLVISSDTAQAANVLRDNLDKLSKVGSAFGNILLVEMLPPLTAVTNALLAFVREGNSVKNTASTVAESFAWVTKTAAGAAVTIAITAKALGALAAIIENWKSPGQVEIIGKEFGRDAEEMIEKFTALVRSLDEGGRAFQTFRDNWDPDALGSMFKHAAPQIANKQDLDIQIAAVREFATQYEAAIKLQNALVKEAAAQGQLTRQEEITQTSAAQRALMEVQVIGLQQEAEIYRQRGEKAKEFVAQQKINALEAMQASADVIAQAQIATADQADEKRFAELQAQRALQRAQEVEQIRRSTMTQREIEVESYAQRRKMIEDQMALDFENAEWYYRMLEDLRVQHEAAMGDIAAQGAIQRRNFEQMTLVEQAHALSNHLSTITSSVAQHNRFLFNLNKVAGISEAIINAYIGISKSLSAYPYPWNLVAAAAHAVVAFAQVQKIASTQFGQSSYAPSISGTSAGVPVQPVNQQQNGGGNGQTTIIQLRGEIFSRQQLRELIEQLNENGRDGGRIVLA